MPLYEYEIINQSTGESLGSVNLPLAVDDRDAVTLRRAPLPRSLSVSGHAENPNTQRNQVLAGYKRAEQRLGNTSEFRHKIGHSPSEVKRIWAMPAV